VSCLVTSRSRSFDMTGRFEIGRYELASAVSRPGFLRTVPYVCDRYQLFSLPWDNAPVEIDWRQPQEHIWPILFTKAKGKLYLFCAYMFCLQITLMLFQSLFHHLINIFVEFKFVARLAKLYYIFNYRIYSHISRSTYNSPPYLSPYVIQNH